MNITTETRTGGLLLTVGGSRIDAASAVQFKDEMRRLAGDASGRIVVDMGRVDFIDSSGLGAIVSVMKQLGAERRMDLAALTPNVAKVFRLTRMDTVFVIHASVEDAFNGLEHAS
jgi:anti-sigma B factor antagonist